MPTLVDLDPRLDDDDAYEAVVREAMFHGRFDPAAVSDALKRRRARRLARHLDDETPTQTVIENRFLAICRRHRIPPPLTQQGAAPRLDVLWPGSRLGVEADGYLVLRFTWEDLTQRPAMVAAQIREALGIG